MDDLHSAKLIKHCGRYHSQEKIYIVQNTYLAPLANTNRIDGRLHLVFLDGLRGIAALYVVLYHVYYKFYTIDNLGTTSDPFTKLPLGAIFRYGECAVVAFIVLSGFCLMLPAVNREFSNLTDISSFFKRRARRILPPYYAALFLSIGMIIANQHFTSAGHISLPSIISHLFLFHNFSNAWRNEINAPMWSVATEWQIYFLFPFFLFPLWKRFGNIKFLFAVSIIAAILINFPLTNNWAASVSLHMSVAFSLGMIAVSVLKKLSVVASVEKPSKWYFHLAFWRLFVFITTVVILSLAATAPHMYEKRIWISDTLFAGYVGILLVTCALNQDKNTKDSIYLPRVIFESRFAVWIGSFSYSLYLIHSPILAAFFTLLKKFRLDINMTFYLMMSVGVPLTFIIAYGFFLLFEKPFIRVRSASLPAN